MRMFQNRLWQIAGNLNDSMKYNVIYRIPLPEANYCSEYEMVQWRRWKESPLGDRHQIFLVLSMPKKRTYLTLSQNKTCGEKSRLLSAHNKSELVDTLRLVSEVQLAIW